jgi:NAD(P)-dependent dehydrogenase (short-subunit alcohol dehydrogenase family)
LFHVLRHYTLTVMTGERNGLSLDGRRALVTGGGAGLGRQMAEALAGAGAGVVICGRRAAPLEETARALADRGVAVEQVAADVTVDTDLRRLRDAAGAVDILVNNAALSIRTPWHEVPLEEWREVMAVNVEAPLRLAQLFVPAMVDRGWGRVINVASMYGVVAGDPALYGEAGVDAASYFASKHALIGLTKHLAVMVGGTGVTVNALCPGAFPNTPANASVATDDVTRAFAARTPVKRVGTDDDLRAAIVYLASPGSAFYTGQNMIVDGGWTIW